MTVARRNQVRIIGGQWRGRKLDFPDVEGLRPTPDRVRETVFNWLQPVIAGARCLDICAGTGCFGIEAVSRGASYALLVENNTAAVNAIQAMVTKLQTDQVNVHRGDAQAFLAHPAPDQARFNIVFLDPPYASQLMLPCLQRVCTPAWLAPDALLYFEMPKSATPVALPATLTVVKENSAGQVAYFLARYRAPT